MSQLLSDTIFLGIILLFTYQCQTASSFICPSDRGYYPHEVLCDSFYVCYQNKAYLNVCPQSQLFDEDILQCSEASEVDCGRRSRDGVTQPPATTTTEAVWTNPPTNPPTPSSRPKPTTSPRPKPTTSPKPEPTPGPIITTTGTEEVFDCPEQEGLFPHPVDIHKFLQCKDYYAFVLQCPHNLVFDPIVKVCSW